MLFMLSLTAEDIYETANGNGAIVCGRELYNGSLDIWTETTAVGWTG